MEYYGNRIAVTVSELTGSEDSDAVMTYGNYKNLYSRHRITILRPGKGMGSYALVEFASLPERFRNKFIAKYGDPETILAKKDEMVTVTDEALEWYAGYVMPDGSHVKTAKQKEYALNAAVLDRLQEMVNTQRSCRNMSGNRTPITWTSIYEECERLREECGHTLPTNVSRLREKMRRYRAEGYVCLVSGKLANANAIKITEEAGRWIISRRRSRVPRYTSAQIFEEYNRTAPSRGWKPLKSMSSLLAYLERPEVKVRWIDTVLGQVAARTTYAIQNHTELPVCRDALWYGDGTKINLYYKAYVNGKYQLASMQSFEVVDAYSEALIGYHISNTENFESMYEAYRDAIETTGHLPVELSFDNQGGTRKEVAKLWLSKISECSRPTAPYNGRSKTIESIFGRFQAQVLSRLWNYTGGNITTKSQRSDVDLEFVQKNLSSLPTQSELIEQYAECRRQWNGQPHPKYGKARIDLYNSSANDRARVATDDVKSRVYTLMSEKPCRYTGRGIEITINKSAYTYQVFGPDGIPDAKWQGENIGREFRLEYDPHDMTSVRLYTEDSYGLRFEAVAQEPVVIHRAMMDQQPGERRYLKDVEIANKKEQVRRWLENHELEMQHGVAPEQHGLITPLPAGMSAKEFEGFADQIRIGNGQGPAEVYPATIGETTKSESNMTKDQLLSYYDRI